MKQSGQHHSSSKLLVVIVAVLSLAGCSGDLDKIKALQAENAKLQSANAELNSRNSALEGDNSMLRSTSMALANANGSLENNSGLLAAHAGLLEREGNSLKSQNTDLSGKVLQLQNFTRYDGVWECDKGADTDNALSYRVLTSDSWALITFNKNTNALVVGKVGTYVVKDGIYQEFVNVPTPADKDKDNVTQFTIDPDGNGMTNGPEHWKRVNLE